MVGGVCVIFLWGSITYSLSAPSPLDSVNINPNLGEHITTGYTNQQDTNGSDYQDQGHHYHPTQWELKLPSHMKVTEESGAKENNQNIVAKYRKMEDGQLCSGSWFRITTEGDCKAAADVLSLKWAHSWNGNGDFPGCLYANDGRNSVFFNSSPFPSNVANNPKYAAICKGDRDCNQSCTNFMNSKGFGRCKKVSRTVGALVCYVQSTSTCSDKLPSKTNRGKYFSALACKKEDCNQSCTNFMNRKGFGQCKKKSRRVRAFICYVQSTSSCSDKLPSTSDQGKYFSALACKNKESSRQPTPVQPEALQGQRQQGHCEISMCSSTAGCPLVKNNLLTTLPELAKEFSISFEFIAKQKDKLTEWQNVIQFTEGGACCVVGQRVPGLFHTYDGLLYIAFPINGLGYEGKFTRNIYPMDRWHHMEFSQTLERSQYIFRVIIDGLKEIEEKNNRPKIFSNVKVYAANEWDDTLRGSLRNLCINTYSEATPPTPSIAPTPQPTPPPSPQTTPPTPSIAPTPQPTPPPSPQTSQSTPSIAPTTRSTPAPSAKTSQSTPSIAPTTRSTPAPSAKTSPSTPSIAPTLQPTPARSATPNASWWQTNITGIGIENVGKNNGVNNTGVNNGLGNIGNNNGVNNTGDLNGIFNVGENNGINNVGNLNGGNNIGSNNGNNNVGSNNGRGNKGSNNGNNNNGGNEQDPKIVRQTVIEKLKENREHIKELLNDK